MKNQNPIQIKSYQFALRIIRLHQFLTHTSREYDLSRQILRSGTSIGANVEEAIGGSTKKEFKHKLSISYREARETHYWLRLLRDCDYLKEEEASSLIEDCEELLRILGSIIRTTKSNL